MIWFLLGTMVGHGGGNSCQPEHVWTAAEKARWAAFIAQQDADTKALLLWFFAGVVAFVALTVWASMRGWLDWLPGPMPYMYVTTTIPPYLQAVMPPAEEP